MLSDPVNIFFSHFIFGAAALILTGVAANTILNLIDAIKNRRRNAMLAEALGKVLGGVRRDDDERPN